MSSRYVHPRPRSEWPRIASEGKGTYMASFTVVFTAQTGEDKTDVTADYFEDRAPFLDFVVRRSSSIDVVARYRAEDIFSVIRND